VQKRRIKNAKEGGLMACPLRASGKFHLGLRTPWGKTSVFFYFVINQCFSSRKEKISKTQTPS